MLKFSKYLNFFSKITFSLLLTNQSFHSVDIDERENECEKLSCRMPQKFPKKILANLIEMLSDQFKNHLFLSTYPIGHMQE